MTQRRIRTEDEVERFLAADPSLRELKDGLESIPGLEVDADGEGEGLFKVYLRNCKAPFESFLWIKRPRRGRIYATWQHGSKRDGTQRSCPVGKSIWARIVKSPEKPNGSEVRESVPLEQVFAAVREYVDRLGPGSVRHAKDLEEPPDRIQTIITRIVRDTARAKRVKQLHDYTCQVCGETLPLPDGSRYAEAHHVKPLGQPHNGPDVPENIIVLCPNHHALCDYGAITLNHDVLNSHMDHRVGREFVEYHNDVVVPKCGE